MKYIKSFKELKKSDTNIAGGKGASLGEMTNVNIPVPKGFVILTNAFDSFIDEQDLRQEIRSELNNAENDKIHTVEKASKNIQNLILKSDIPENIVEETKKEFNKLKTKYVAVRSSATAEDGLENAWAGQLDSFLNTIGEKLLDNVKKCWASLFTPRAIFYRFEKGLKDSNVSVAVVIQEMIDSEMSGIAFSVHPVTEDSNQILIEAGLGLGEAIVSGSITPDSYTISKKDDYIIDININEQNKALYRNDKGGNSWKKLNKQSANKQVLAEKQIVELSGIIKKIEKHYGVPQDIEWAFANNEFYITQSRPITTLKEGRGVEIKFELEFIRELPISLYHVWFEGHLFANTVILNMPEKPAKNVYAIFNNGMANIYTQEKNIEKMKKAIIGLDEVYLKNILRQYQLNFSRFGKKDKKVTDRKFMKQLIGQFVITFILGDMLDHSLQSKALKLRKETERIFSLIHKFLKEIAPDKEFFEYYSYEEILKGKIIKPKVLNQRKISQLTSGAIIPIVKNDSIIIPHDNLENMKYFIKQHSREYSLFRVYSLFENYEKLAYKTFNHKVTGVCHVYTGNLVDTYYTKNSWDELFKSIEKKARTKFFLQKQIKKLYEHFNFLLPYYKCDKRISSISELKQVYSEYTKYYLLHGMIIAIPIIKSLPKKTREIALKVRTDIQQYGDTIEEVFKEGLEKLYPHLKGKTQFILPKEIWLKTINDKQYMSREIRKREEGFIFYRGVIYTGNLEKILHNLDITITDQMPIKNKIITRNDKKILRGQIAYKKGKVVGKARIISKIRDLSKVKSGDILVAPMTTPKYIPAIKKVSAIITDEGGITCHAAIISRELKKPCIVGIKIATKVLTDGDLVEVNTNKGVVRIISKNE